MTEPYLAEKGDKGDKGERGLPGERGFPGNNVSRRKQWIAILLLLSPPWMLFLLCCYWLFIDNDSPVTIVYQSEMFTAVRVENRDEARRNAISETVGGEDVYIWRENCVSREVIGDSRPLWRSDDFVWSPPQRTTMLLLGCTGRSFQIDTPVVKKTQVYTYYRVDAYRINQLTVVDVYYPPVSIVLRAK